jgi:hypothetical protein
VFYRSARRVICRGGWAVSYEIATAPLSLFLVALVDVARPYIDWNDFGVEQVEDVLHERDEFFLRLIGTEHCVPYTLGLVETALDLGFFEFLLKPLDYGR